MRGDVMPELAENTLRQVRCVRRRTCWDVQRAYLKKNKNKRAESLTVKALDPFSPFISLAPNIKHAMEETKYWVRHNNTLCC